MSNQPPYLPDSAPFTAEQRAWLNGFLAGIYGSAPAASAAGDTPPTKTALVLYGSQTGTAEGLAKKFAKAAKAKNLDARVLGMDQHSQVQWESEQFVFLLTSTYGEGEMPDNARGLWDHLSSDNAPRLSHLEYSVLSLGDTNYEQFCKAGREFDRRLEELGARRLHDRIDCDVDYDAPFARWQEGVLAALDAPEQSNKSDVSDRSDVAPLSVYSKNNPYPTRLLAHHDLTPRGSDKETRHYELALTELEYEVGDALGVFPVNCAQLVQETIAALGADPESVVPLPDGGNARLRDALAREYDITKPSKQLLGRLADLAADSELASSLPDAAALKQFLWGKEIIDLLLLAPIGSLSAVEFVRLLRKMAPRLYSISSSPKAHSGEVHLTVASVRYETEGRGRKGVCSTFLADRCGPEDPIRVFVQPSHGFRLPADRTKPVIMVGPGTGIAPFRAFLEEREATGAPGKNWLFFGERHESSGFFYRDQLTRMLERGVLTRLSTAFSRDQQEKIYVQDRMREHGTEIWAWLQAGAHFYVCGDASRMAKDVDAALHEICAVIGGLGKEEAAAYLNQLKTDKRYQRDVY